MTLIAFVFPKLWSPIVNAVNVYKRGNLQHGKRAEALWNSLFQYLYHIHWSLARELSWKKSPLLTCKVLGCLFTPLLLMTNIVFFIETI